MNTFDEMITTFVRQIRYAPTYSSYSDFVDMTKAFVEKLTVAPRCVYGLYDMKADSMTVSPTLISLHSTVDGADAAVPKNLRQYNREPWGEYVKDYGYVAIRKIEVQVP